MRGAAQIVLKQFYFRWPAFLAVALVRLGRAVVKKMARYGKCILKAKLLGCTVRDGLESTIEVAFFKLDLLLF